MGIMQNFNWQEILKDLNIPILENSKAELENNNLLIKLPSSFSKDYIESKYKKEIENLLTNKYGNKSISINFSEDISLNENNKPDTLPLFNETIKREENLKYTFENFVVGESNKLAYNTSYDVAKKPGKTYNPLFIYSSVGMGKTHLLHAIRNYILKNNPNKKMMYVHTDEFISKFVSDVKGNSGSTFLEKFKKLDIFLVDDIYFLAKKRAVQDEFFFTFNRIFERGGQIVVTSDRKPGEMMDVADRIISRFTGGVIMPIFAPDIHLRITILENEIKNNNINISNELIQKIAKNLKGDVRQLKGVIKKLNIYSSNGLPVTEQMVDQTIEDILFKNKCIDKSSVSLEQIINTVANHFNINPSEIKDKKRGIRYDRARLIAMYLCYEFSDVSYRKLQNVFDRSPSVIQNAYKKIKEQLKADEDLTNETNEVINKICSISVL